MKNRIRKTVRAFPAESTATALPFPASGIVGWMKTAIFFAASVVVLVAGFNSNALKEVLPRQYQFTVYNVSGDASILDAMRVSARWGMTVNCGLSYDHTMHGVIGDALLPDGQANLHREKVYTSQPAFHRIVYSLLYRVVGGDLDSFFEGLKTAMAVLLALVVSLFAWRIGREFGYGAAVVVVLMALLSDWMAFVARSPWDIYFLKFTPFLATWFLYPRVLDGRMRFGTLMGIVGGCVFLNAASVYEFISNVIMGASVGVVYFGVVRGVPWRTVGRHALAVTAIGLGAFALVLVLHFIQVSAFEGSLHGGLQRITEKIAERTYGADASWESNQGPGKHYGSAPPEVSVLTILHGYSTLKAFSVPFTDAEPRIYLTFFSFFMLALAFLPFSLIDTSRFPAMAPYRKRLLGLAGALIVSFVGTMSWPLGAKGHMFHHMHQDGICFYLTFMLVLYAATGAVVALVGAEIKRRVKSRWFS